MAYALLALCGYGSDYALVSGYSVYEGMGTRRGEDLDANGAEETIPQRSHAHLGVRFFTILFLAVLILEF